jgi:hypothetical protein
MRFQAEHIATQRLHNGGYNCVASQVVVVPSDWAQKDRFLTHLRAALASHAGAERISGGRVLIGNSIRPHPARRRPPSTSPRSLPSSNSPVTPGSSWTRRSASRTRSSPARSV